MKIEHEQFNRIRESLKNRGLLPPEELYEAFKQFWRRPDDDEIQEVRYFSVHDGWSHVIPIKTQGTSCWQWDEYKRDFEKPIEIDDPRGGWPISILTAVTHIIMEDKSDRNHQFYLQRVPSYKYNSKRSLPGLILRVDREGCYGWNPAKNDFDVFLEGHSNDGGLIYFHSRLEWGIDEPPVYFRIINRYLARLAQRAMDGKCDYYINPIIGVAYAILDGKYMKWQDDDFTLPMSWGEKALVNRGESVKVCREEACVYMLEYADIMYGNEIESLAEAYYERQADIARGK